jgi:hypothetical protein
MNNKKKEDSKPSEDLKADPKQALQGCFGLIIFCVLIIVLVTSCTFVMDTFSGNDTKKENVPKPTVSIKDEKQLQALQDFIVQNNYSCPEIYNARQMMTKQGFEVVCWRNSNHQSLYTYEILDRGGRMEIVVK